jgi:hypothetical protein
VNIISSPRQRTRTLKKILEEISVALNLSKYEAITIANENNDNKNRGTMNGDFILIHSNI